jgi:NAD+ kinase
VPPELPFRRVALVVHPTRAIDNALATLRRWTEENGIELVQLPNSGEAHRQVAPPTDLEAGDLVVAVGGDGTVLRALRAAASRDAPVLGVACGSLGALSAVTAEELADALDRFRAGDWARRSLPALAIAAPGAADDWAVNDFVVVRGGTGQLAADISVDGELYVRLAGDGVIVATPLGSSAYSMAAGGPILDAGTPAFVCTPLAMHGGSAPPLVVSASAVLDVDVYPSYAGGKVEVDGDRRSLEAGRFRLTLHADKLSLVTFAGAEHGLATLRRRRLITDSPRILARDDRRPG